jgi:hypothetical protein
MRSEQVPNTGRHEPLHVMVHVIHPCRGRQSDEC